MFNSFENKSHLYENPNNMDGLGCTLNKAGSVEHIFYDLNSPIADIYYIDNNDIEIFKKILFRKEHRNYFVFELLNKMIDVGVDFSLSSCKSKKAFQKISLKKGYN